MSDYLIVATFAAAIIIGANIVQNLMRNKKLRKSIHHSWGVLPENDYDEYDYKNFSQLFNFRNKKGAEMTVDDITWNDLELGNFFSFINCTITSMGDNALYCLLRTPLYNKEKLLERINTINYWNNHRDEREMTQTILTRVGKFRPSRMDLLMDKCDFLELEKPWVFKVLTCVPFLAIPLLFISYGFAALWAIMSMALNAFYHGYKVREISAGMEAVVQATKIISLAKKLYKNKPQGLNFKYEKIKVLSNILEPILNKGSFNSVLMGFTGNISMDVMSMFNMVFLIDLWLYQSSLKFIEHHHEDFACLIEAIGEIDATISIASYKEYLSREENSGYFCEPELIWNASNNDFNIQADGVVHPLIKRCTPNPVISLKPTLITGSNASGKSTYLKTVVINTLMVHTLGFCLAKKWVSKPLFPITSMALRDNMLNGESYFIAEIKSLKRIFSRVNSEITCLCVIDEVLRGTNTIERIAASSQLLHALSRENTCIFAATHDIELTYILSDVFSNKHFEEDINDDDIIFDYKIKDGRATSRNAIKLLKIMGFSSDIIKNANDAVEVFERQNKWTKLEGDYK